MGSRFNKAALSVAAGALWVTVSLAQPPGPGRGPGGPGPGAAPATGDVMVANPTYTTLVMEIAIDRPAEEVWKRVGKVGDIGEWCQLTCAITYGMCAVCAAVGSLPG